jgi:hypothetical protein
MYIYNGFLLIYNYFKILLQVAFQFTTYRVHYSYIFILIILFLLNYVYINFKGHAKQCIQCIYIKHNKNRNKT